MKLTWLLWSFAGLVKPVNRLLGEGSEPEPPGRSCAIRWGPHRVGVGRIIYFELR